jgi:hypothetical protein
MSAIYLKKVKDVTSRIVMSSSVGSIEPTHEIYSTVAEIMERVEKETGLSRLPPSVVDGAMSTSPPRSFSD